ncbi:MAG: GIY-YIG nuclease family protein [Desulfosporosinus sp.]|nr:GIY-YIG nuclease family protein [Desulfosporosinus sp.]
MESMRKYAVYAHTNKINGKKYFGITSTHTKERWRDGRGYINNQYFNSDIEEYGWDNFTHEIISSGIPKESAERLELDLIAMYKTINRQFGYNIKSGGDTSLHSEESKAKMSANHADFRGKNNPMCGKCHSDSTRSKIGERSRGRYFSEDARKKISMAVSGRNNPMYGKSHSEESRKKIGLSKLGENNPGAHSVVNLNTGRVFTLVNDASKFFEISHSTIVNCCRGRRKSAGKHPETNEPLRWMYHEDYLKMSNV